MTALKLSFVNPYVVKIPAGSRLRSHNVFMPSTIHFPSRLNRKETMLMQCRFSNNGSSNFIYKNTFVELMHNPNLATLVTSGGSSFSFRSSLSSSRGGSGFSYSVPYSAPSRCVRVCAGSGVAIFFAFILFPIAVFAFVAFVTFLTLSLFECSTVLKLQVGLMDSGKSLEKDLNWIAQTADTSTSEGVHYLLTETILVLLRNPDYCISAYSSADVKFCPNRRAIRFNELSIEERAKSVNVNNIKKQWSTTVGGGGNSNSYIVLTILVHAGGLHNLPSIRKTKDLKNALRKMASIPWDRTQVLRRNFQHEDDRLSEREMLADYPLLRPL